MKYSETDSIENEIINNDYVTYDVKEKNSATGILNKIKHSEFFHDKLSLIIIPVMVLTLVSLGFLISQIAEYSGLSAVSTILT